ncbi:DNA-processing protein DprA [Helicobacter labacensis]|uniref:DNA-processing protein DprA n=1 Tax=Helicobacter labacensis TaxID=2316079 RepID=UPI000EAC8AEC|nr:DNA-processing protein DprA [Helicobacter labacensis]
MLSHFDYRALDSCPMCLGKLKHPPKQLYFTGQLDLLHAPLKVAIVGSRTPSQYTQHTCATLARTIAKCGGVVVSGGALGVDIIAQYSALPHTIMVAPCSLDRLYPPANARVISLIAQEGLILSEYKENFSPYRHSFLERNRLVVGLSDVVIIPEANLHSGSMSSAKLALSHQKPLFVLPQRLGESGGTQALLQAHKAQAIYDIDAFCAKLAQDYALTPPRSLRDVLLAFFKHAPTYEQAYARFGDLLTQYELEGLITRRNGCVVLA